MNGGHAGRGSQRCDVKDGISDMLDKKSLFAVNLILCLIISLEDDSRAERGKGNDYRGTE